MAERPGFPKRVFIEDVRRDGTYLRVTWHAEGRAFVISHWTDTVCTAATRVAVEDAPRLVALLADGLGDAAATPIPEPLVARSRPSPIDRLRTWLRRGAVTAEPADADVVPLPSPTVSVFDEPRWGAGS
jgi:hypothetical protein